MRPKKFASMTIAIVGITQIALEYAAGFAKSGHEVMIAGKNGEDVVLSPTLEAMPNVQVASIEYAAAIADLVLIAVPPADVREVAYWLGDVRKKVIIDVTGNVFSGIEPQVKTICAIKAITGSPHIVKVFNTNGYERLMKPLFMGAELDLILVGDSKKAKEITKILAVELNMKYFYDFGGNDDILLFNEMTRCLRNLLQQHQEKAPSLVPIKR